MHIHNRVFREGEGTPLVLVNAFPIDGRMWERCAADIIDKADAAGLKDFPIWAPDMPGSGLSGVPSAADSGPREANGAYPEALDRVADAYVDLLHAAGHDKAVWAGLSMGGYVVTDLFRRHPDSVAGIALIDTMAASDGVGGEGRLATADRLEREGTLDAVRHFAEPAEGDSTVKRSAAFIELMRGWIEDQDPAGCAWRQRMTYGRSDLTGVPATIDVPAAVITGTNDPTSNPSVMRPLAERIGGNATLTVIEDCGHFSAVEHPVEVAQALVALMSRCR